LDALECWFRARFFDGRIGFFRVLLFARGDEEGE
jgi:hypothetical protein